MSFPFNKSGLFTGNGLLDLNAASNSDPVIGNQIASPFAAGIGVAGIAGGRLIGAMDIWASATGSTSLLSGGSDSWASPLEIDDLSVVGLSESADTAGSHAAKAQQSSDVSTTAAPDIVLRANDSGPTGQLWYATEGGDAETKIVRINNDGTSSTTVVDNGVGGTGDDKLVSSFTSDLGVDTAAGFYFAILSSPLDDHAVLVRGAIGSSAAPTTVIDFPDDIIVNTIQIDASNHKIYATYMDGQTADPAGIRIYSYNPSTGALTDDGFLVTAATDSRGQEGGYDILDPRDMALDTSIGRLFYTETLTGGVNATGLFRLDLSNPDATTQLVSQSQFPDDGSNGYIIDVEVDQTTDLVYFSTQSQHASPYVDYVASQNAIWYISENATEGTPTKVTLNGMPGGSLFYPGDMTFDQGSRQIYVETEETDGVGTDDVIYVFQLDGAGTSATLIKTVNPGLTTIGANIEGLAFSHIAALDDLTGTSTAAVEQQATATTLLAGAPSISDFDGNYLTSAKVQITGGTFTSNESSTSDDHLGYGAAKQISGTISGTNITISWTAATETLTLTGYDTLANYQSVLSAITYWATGDNPTNYGLNTSRTITWTISDGTLDVPGGSINSGTTTLNITGVNDAPVNSTVTSATGNEDTDIAITGLQMSDADTNAALTNVTVTLSVTKGVLTLLTNVASGLSAGDIAGNGSASVTLTGTLNEINTTLAAVNGLIFKGNANVFGTDTLTVVTNDGGNSGTGGALSDTDNYTITINAINDAHTGGASISGLTTEDQVLTAVSTIADADGIGTLHYQWQRDSGGGYANVGTDDANYTLGDADVGGIFRVTISYTDGAGNLESATSDPTAAITNVDDIAVAQNDTFTTIETTAIGTGLSVFDDNGNGADSDPDSALSIIEVNGVAANVGAAITLASGALLTLNANGTFSYDPNGAFDKVPGSASGASNLISQDTFTYTLAGGDAGTVVVDISGIDSDGDVLRGISGTNDTLTGGIGSDNYFVDDAGDTIVEIGGEGTADRVSAVVSFALAADDDIEIMSTSSSSSKAAINLKGNALSQTIYGNAGKNILHDGGAGGADRMLGGDGNDTYVVYNASDVIVERAGEGNDRVSAGVSYVLGSGTEIELLNTTSLNATRTIDLTGNRFSQIIRGNAGDNVLNDGGAGDADTLIGGGGNDAYIVYNSGDTITELAGQGDDRVSAAVDFVLTNNANVEYLNTTSLLGTQAIDLTGNNLDQLVRGNAGTNTIDGGDGSDLLYGMGGQDSFRFSTTLSDGNVDRIGDFSAANDTIELDHSIFSALSVGALAASAFKDSAVGVKDADDRIIYNSDTGALVYDADGSGSAFDSVRFATVIGDPILTAADFFVV